MLLYNYIIRTLANRYSVIFSSSNCTLVVSLLNWEEFHTLVVWLSCDQINATFSSNQQLCVPDRILEINSKMERNFIWIFYHEITSRYLVHIVIEEVDGRDSAISTCNNYFFWSRCNWVLLTIKLGHGFEHLCGCDCCEIWIKIEIVPIQRVVLNCETL